MQNTRQNAFVRPDLTKKITKMYKICEKNKKKRSEFGKKWSEIDKKRV